MSDKPECPTCHSLINSDSLYSLQGEVEPGEDTEITDPLTGKQINIKTSTSGAIPQWTFDPILTENGFNGDSYKGRMRFVGDIIRELQYARIGEEDAAGISDDLKTQFTFLETINFRDTEALWIELRQSTEKILNAIGSTLEEYFSTDLDGEARDAGPNDTPNKEEWDLVQRGKPYVDSNGEVKTQFELPNGTMKDSPGLPNRSRPWANIIEELRHPLILGWREFWSTTLSSLFRDVNIDFNTIQLNYSHTDPPNYVPELIIRSFGDDSTTIRAIFPIPIVTAPFVHLITPNGFIESSILANPNKFPTGKDIHPSDGGNQYLYDFVNMDNAIPAYGIKITDPKTGKITYKIDNTWILFGSCVNEDINFSSHSLWSGDPGSLVGCPIDIAVDGTYSGTLRNSATVSILEDANAEIIAINPNAKSIHIHTKAISNFTTSGYIDVFVGQSEFSPASVGINHNWQFDNLQGILGIDTHFDPSIPQYDINALKNRLIKVVYNTHFKFFVEVKKKVGPWFGDFNFIENPSFPRDVFLNQLVDDARFNRYATTVPAFNGIFGIGYDPNFNLFTCLLGVSSVNQVGITKIQLIFTDPPTPLTDPTLIQSASGLYGGQTFKFIKPAVGYGDIVTVYLGNKSVYDVSICLDDLLYAFSTIGGPSYVSHKQQLPGGHIVENPLGTLVYLNQVEFVGSSVCGTKRSASTLIPSGYPECSLQIVPGTVQNYNSELEVSLTAIRIENNSKTILS